MVVRMERESRSALAKSRNSEKTEGLISWLSSIKSTGRYRELSMCWSHFSRSALALAQRLWGDKGTLNK